MRLFVGTWISSMRMPACVCVCADNSDDCPISLNFQSSFLETIGERERYKFLLMSCDDDGGGGARFGRVGQQEQMGFNDSLL